MAQIQFPDFMAVTFGLVTYLLGEAINDRVALLRRFSIPDAVTGGLLVALLFFALHETGIAEVGFDTHARDLLLLIFFTGIGLNARVTDLLHGGKPLAILVAITAALLLVQNLIGGLAALVAGLPPAWASSSARPRSSAATAPSSPGPPSSPPAASPAPPRSASPWPPSASSSPASSAARSRAADRAARPPLRRARRGQPRRPLRHRAPPEAITRNALMRTLLDVFLCIIAGYLLQRAILAHGVMLPLFVPCLLVGIVVGNLMPLVPFLKPVAHTPALSLVSEFALGVFLAVSLMALQLWALAGMAGTLLAVLLVQTVVAVAASVLVAFRFLGRDYQAAVMSAGYASFVLGATPTAIATMTAVTKRYGPCQTAFIVLPLVSAVFVDIANALVTQGFLDLWTP